MHSQQTSHSQRTLEHRQVQLQPSMKKLRHHLKERLCSGSISFSEADAIVTLHTHQEFMDQRKAEQMTKELQILSQYCNKANGAKMREDMICRYFRKSNSRLPSENDLRIQEGEGGA